MQSTKHSCCLDTLALSLVVNCRWISRSVCLSSVYIACVSHKEVNFLVTSFHYGRLFASRIVCFAFSSIGLRSFSAPVQGVAKLRQIMMECIFLRWFKCNLRKQCVQSKRHGDCHSRLASKRFAKHTVYHFVSICQRCPSVLMVMHSKN